MENRPTASNASASAADPAADATAATTPGADPETVNIEFTKFGKSAGALTKRISLIDGKIHSDGGECRMAQGKARRMQFSGEVRQVMQEFADCITGFPARWALALGRLKDGGAQA
jgi:hypothetical protein